MFFNSPEFIAFFSLVLLLVVLCNREGQQLWRNGILLVASYYFYGNLNILYPILLVFVTLVNYAGVLLLVKAGEKVSRRKKIMGSTVVLSLLPLLFLKYAPAYLSSVWLPVGVSFFTFQALTYSLDVYREKIQPVRNMGELALFVAFFPTLLSGPIERARSLIPQLRGVLPINWDGLMTGGQIFVWGLFKKVVIADRLSLYVNEVYLSPLSHSGSTLALAAVLYSFQIYCDFSGYASMAIGTGRMLGIRLMNNFEYPYFAPTIKDFWRRWHISLTSWFTEYVYISMGGNRVSWLRWILNIYTVFLISGIWHGATWSFVIWGGLHALLYLTEHVLKIRDTWFIYRIFVFIAVTVAWIFFRTGDASTAFHMIGKIVRESNSIPAWGNSAFSLAVTLCLLFCFLIVEYGMYKNWVPSRKWMTVSGILLLIVTIALFGITNNQFVYFQF